MDLSELRKKAEAATPGPWTHDVGNHQIETAEDRIEIVNAVSNHDRAEDVKYRYGEGSALLSKIKDEYDDMEFIAAFNPSVALEILDRISSLEAQLAKSEARVKELEDKIKRCLK